MKDQRKNYLLRINEELWNELNQWAEQDFRSLNGQIELILRRAVEERRKGSLKAHPADNPVKPPGSTDQ